MTIEPSTSAQDWNGDAARLVDVAQRIDRDLAIRLLAAGLKAAHASGKLAGLHKADRIVAEVVANYRRANAGQSIMD